MRSFARLCSYGRMEYRAAWSLQHQLVAGRLLGRRPNTVLLGEHFPVITIGRSGKAEHWRPMAAAESLPFPVHHVERGGSVTYHGPGQLVVYPILALRQFCSGPRQYVFQLEEVILRSLQAWGVNGYRIDKRPGIWVGKDAPAKIAFVGVAVTQGITLHGFALNISVSLDPFRLMAPCGIPDCQVTRLVDGVHAPVSVTAVRERVAREFAHVFGLDWVDEHLERLPAEGLPVVAPVDWPSMAERSAPYGEGPHA